MVTRSFLSNGKFGIKLNAPPGEEILSDDETGFTFYDQEKRLQWSFNFFENLHMDQSYETRDHLRAAIESYGRATFENNFRENVPLQSSMRPRTEEDPSWSPIIDVEYIDIASNDGGETSGLMIVHRTAYRPGEQVVMGRLCIPVRRGLFEVIVIAGERGTGWRESSIIASNSKSREETMTAERLQLLLKSYKFDDIQYDSQFPNHCLSRVRAAMAWLINESQLVVTAKPAAFIPAGQEVELKQLRCRVVPPKRFIYSPDTHKPESNKPRFCRASLGGTGGVQMLVISCWYVKNSGKGMNGLRQVAMHGSRAIHESQQFDNIRVSLEEISSKRRWFGFGKRMILAWVSCEEQGQRRQNTIGWIRESSSGIVFLVYFADTLELEKDEIRNDLVDTLSSIRAQPSAPRRLSAKQSWGASRELEIENRQA